MPITEITWNPGNHGLGTVGDGTRTNALSVEETAPGAGVTLIGTGPFVPNATHFLVELPAEVNQSAEFSFTVTALGPGEVIDTDYRGTVNFGSPGSAGTFPPDYTFTHDDQGVHEFVNGATLDDLGPQALSATDVVDASITGEGETEVVAPVILPDGVIFLTGPTLFSTDAIRMYDWDMDPVSTVIDVSISSSAMDANGTNICVFVFPDLLFYNAGGALIATTPFSDPETGFPSVVEIVRDPAGFVVVSRDEVLTPSAALYDNDGNFVESRPTFAAIGDTTTTADFQSQFSGKRNATDGDFYVCITQAGPGGNEFYVTTIDLTTGVRTDISHVTGGGDVGSVYAGVCCNTSAIFVAEKDLAAPQDQSEIVQLDYTGSEVQRVVFNVNGGNGYAMACDEEQMIVWVNQVGPVLHTLVKYYELPSLAATILTPPPVGVAPFVSGGGTTGA